MNLATNFRHNFSESTDLIYLNKCQAIKNGIISQKISSLTNTKFQQQENNFHLIGLSNDEIITATNFTSISNNQLLRKF
jgi:hypothetical protein